ncbi:MULTISPECIES: NAD-dependent epimerase/dehydratase family protein [unclassified Mesorhizobium]|uniref:NAD-dependent epimerase/dehydratase family protein n=1 Tax=unclassified Mesorhizobium TaxID=325217 RepID=UPI0003CF3F6D|nr:MULTISPECIES: NAD-dependent epimerase/dehydratase family protein [unclassified Mesorhizobium]ESX17810.1 epimerase [Mesorhizobium sp. LSJC255A00]ESX26951.1 epimerase [Mesorhizobium sp. LSHC440B00]ESX36139.1 epimerase [Mesorhizobium sp. LSHC432A00]ESX40318.1 epimerase [Mesorhizobium sp. LSHC440A00]ESX74274.1 epimerase [Mesorhizobium sp. LSHC414A00]
MKVLVTGATGFIGRQVVNQLREAGFGVRMASRHPERLDPVSDAVLLPDFDAPAQAFQALMRDVTHVVHCAALNNDRKASEADFMAANATLTAQLARAAAWRTSGRFVYLSSIRAVAGPGFSGTISEATPAAPQCAYGRSKREGEIRMLEAYASRPSDATTLRLPPVYGEGMKGNLAYLMRLSGMPIALSLPAATFSGLRSLMSCESAARTAVYLFSRPQSVRRAYVACDLPPLPVSSIIMAFRDGYGYSLKLSRVPGGLVRTALTLIGKRTAWEAMTATQICDPSVLVSEGWAPQTDSLEQLTELARRYKSGAVQR